MERDPPVVRLDVHLEGHHIVYFHEGEPEAAAARSRAGTKLTEWFAANEKYTNARHIRYDDFPRYFTWNKAQRKWTPRATYRLRTPGAAAAAASSSTSAPPSEHQYDFTRPGSNVVSRLYTISPREGERYFLRMLLLHVPGATSYQSLRTVDGEQHASFRAACHALGLLADDLEWKRALHDAFRSSFVPLTKVFATILAYCSPSSPLDLWQQNKHMFLTDIRHRFCRGQVGNALDSYQAAEAHVLLEIRTYLAILRPNFTLSAFGLPS